jgi:terminal uridylyltransferase
MGGSGSISAPLSPHAMYAKLEMGKSHLHPWPSSTTPSGGTGSFAAPTSSIPVPPQGRNYKTPAGSANPSRSGSLVPGGAHATAIENYKQQHSSNALPSFQPFSPPQIPSILRELNGEPANYISPSTLLSPPTGQRELVGVNDLAKGFEGLGVDLSGKGAPIVGVGEKGGDGKGQQAGPGGGSVGSGVSGEGKKRSL